MGRGKRYNGNEQKLNIKKVIAVIIAFLVIIMFIGIIIKLANPSKDTTEKKVALLYYTAFQNNKWGVIDSSGETVLPPSYDEMILIPNKEKDVFIITYDVNYETGEYSSKAVNDKNVQLFTDYDSVEAIQNYDEQNSIWIESNCLKVKKNGKYGLIDLSGKELLAPEYDSIEPMIQEKNSLITIKDGKKGLVSVTGSKIIGNEYEDITALTSQYEDGYIVKNSENKVGVIGTNKKILLPIEYDDIKHVYSDNTYIVKQGENWKIINTSTSTENAFNYNNATQINSGNIVVEKDGKYGLVTETGAEVIAPQYDNMQHIFQNYYIASKDGKYGVIGADGTTKLDFKYNYLTYIKEADILEGETDGINTDLLDRNFEVKLSGIVSEINTEIGYLRVRVGSEYKYYNFKFEEKKSQDILTSNTLFLAKKDGKYGFVDKNGIVIIDYIYDDATEQNASGFVAVKKDGKWGVVNSKGQTVLEPSLELSNNSVIDFIGVWHLAEDLNAAYYTR